MDVGRLRQNERTRNLGGGFKSPYTCQMPVWRGEEAPDDTCNDLFFSVEERARHLLQGCFGLSDRRRQLRERALLQGGNVNDLRHAPSRLKALRKPELVGLARADSIRMV